MSGNKLAVQTIRHRGATFRLGGRHAAIFHGNGKFLGFYSYIDIKDGDVYAWMPEVEGLEPVREFKQGEWVSHIETGDVFLVVKTDSRDTGWYVLYSKGESGEMVCLSSKELQIKYKHVDT